MRILLLSDIHANLIALEAVLAAADAMGPMDACWVMGDTVGYGPKPNECLQIVRERAAVVVAGNHELAAIGRLNLEDFNFAAARAIRFTSSELTSDNKQFISRLPLRAEREGHTLVHGSPRDPIWEYLTTPMQAVVNLGFFNTPGCTTGHTHAPMLARAKGRTVYFSPPSPGETANIDAERWFINPGSVGQPRDRNPHSAWALLDTDQATVTFHRTQYNVPATQLQMLEAELDEWLIARLPLGM